MIDVERFLQRRLPDLDLRVVASSDHLVVRYAQPAPRGRRFPILFELRRVNGRWTPDRSIERGVIGETLEYLALRVP
ncbi:MAG TPA: hypothetical protein VF618_00565 [Thermoanaerobaculia bacterium]